MTSCLLPLCCGSWKQLEKGNGHIWIKDSFSLQAIGAMHLRDLGSKFDPYSSTDQQGVLLLLLLLLSRFSCVQLCATPETAAHQAPRSLGFSRQERWTGLPFPSPMHESEKWKWKVKVKSLSCVQLFATPWIVAYQAPPSMGFPRQEHWSGVPLPSPNSYYITQQFHSLVMYARKLKIMHPHKNFYVNIHGSIIIIARKRKQPKCPQTDNG